MVGYHKQQAAEVVHQECTYLLVNMHNNECTIHSCNQSWQIIITLSSISLPCRQIAHAYHPQWLCHHLSLTSYEQWQMVQIDSTDLLKHKKFNDKECTVVNPRVHLGKNIELPYKNLAEHSSKQIPHVV